MSYREALDRYRRAAAGEVERRPCRHARLRREGSCGRGWWRCTNPASGREGLAVGGAYCRERCPDRERDERCREGELNRGEDHGDTMAPE
jgi:hypothetical protein